MLYSHIYISWWQKLHAQFPQYYVTKSIVSVVWLWLPVEIAHIHQGWSSNRKRFEFRQDALDVYMASVISLIQSVWYAITLPNRRNICVRICWGLPYLIFFYIFISRYMHADRNKKRHNIVYIYMIALTCGFNPKVYMFFHRSVVVYWSLNKIR